MLGAARVAIILLGLVQTVLGQTSGEKYFPRSVWKASPTVDDGSFDCINYLGSSVRNYLDLAHQSKDTVLKHIYEGSRVILHHTGTLDRDLEAAKKAGLKNKAMQTYMSRFECGEQCLNDQVLTPTLALELFYSPWFNQFYHRDLKRWADVAYHYIIDKKGNVFEGRPINVMGAHAGAVDGINLDCSDSDLSFKDIPFSNDFDFASIGIALEGDFNTDSFAERRLQRDSFVLLLRYLKKTWGIRYLHGHQHYVVKGIKDNLDKVHGVCPGHNVVNEIQALADDAGLNLESNVTYPNRMARTPKGPYRCSFTCVARKKRQNVPSSSEYVNRN